MSRENAIVFWGGGNWECVAHPLDPSPREGACRRAEYVLFSDFPRNFQKNLANLTALWYTESATQFHIFFADGYTGI